MSVSLRCYSTSLGCPKNRVDTERLLGSLGVALVPVESPDEAELVFINTCAFIQPATEESVRTIAQAIADIEELPKRPLLAVAGCLVGRYHAEDLAPELPEVDLWLDNSDLEAWPAMLARKLGLPEPTVPGRILSTGPSYAWLKIRRLPPCLFVLRHPQYPGRAPLPLQGHDRPRGPRPAGSGGQGTESRGAGSHGMGV